MSGFKASEADAGDFPGGRLAWDILHCAGEHHAAVPQRIDLSDCKMLKPYSVACLIALGAKAKGATELVLPTEKSCREHLCRLRLPDWFTCNSGTHESVRATNLVGRKLEARDSGFADDTVELLTGNLGLSVGTSSQLANHLDEIVNNALTHADSPIGTIVVGQSFPLKRSLEIAVLDFGQTIRGHLTKNPAHAHLSSDAAAILAATEEGVTGTVGCNRWGEPNSGIGLFELRRYCAAGHGELAILSGGSLQVFCAHAAGPIQHVFHGGFAGCLVNVRFFAR